MRTTTLDKATCCRCPLDDCYIATKQHDGRWGARKLSFVLVYFLVVINGSRDVVMIMTVFEESVKLVATSCRSPSLHPF